MVVSKSRRTFTKIKIMTDIFGNKGPVQIEIGEWWFNGNIIQSQTHPGLSPYISYKDSEDSYSYTARHSTKKEAVKYCLENPCMHPTSFPHDYLGGKRYYKIVEQDKNQVIKTLFHGINGTRKLPLNTWVKARIIPNVADGVGATYTSGIHIIDGLEEAKKYLGRFRRGDRIIVECLARGLRKKEKSRSKVYLANEVLIIGNSVII